MQLPRTFAKPLREALETCVQNVSTYINCIFRIRSSHLKPQWKTLAQLRNEGKIRLIALSNVTQEHIERARRIVPIVSVQNRY